MRAEPDHTVADLTAALSKHLALPSSSAVRLRLHTIGGVPHDSSMQADEPKVGLLLDPSTLLVDAGLLSGDRLVLTRGPGPQARSLAPLGTGDDVGPWLVVASGPDVGQSIEIGAGVTVGRDRSCDLSLRDPNVARQVLRVESGSDGSDPTVALIYPSSGADASVNGAPLAEAAVPCDERAGLERGAAITVGDVVRIGATTLRLEPARPRPSCRLCPGCRLCAGSEEESARARLGEVMIDRAPQRSCPLEPVVLAPLGELPERQEPPRFALLVALAPLILGITLAIVYSPRMLLFAVFAPVMAGASYWEARRRNKARFADSVQRTRERLTGRCSEIEQTLEAERRRRFELAPDLTEVVDRLQAERSGIWGRDAVGVDGLALRVGLGSAPALVEIEPEPRGDDGMRDEIAAAVAGYGELLDVPIVVDLAAATVLTLVGERVDTCELASSLVVQATYLHAPGDLVIVGVLDDDHPMAAWLGWLPHAAGANSHLPSEYTSGEYASGECTSGDRTAREQTGMGVGAVAGNSSLRDLVALAEQRLTSGRAEPTDRPHVLVVIDDTLPLEPAVVAELLNAAPSAQLSVLWLAERADRVPWQTAVTISCRPVVSAQPSTIVRADPSVEAAPLEIDRLPTDRAHRFAMALAPCRDSTAAGPQRSLPGLVTLRQALSTPQIDEPWVTTRWRDASRGSIPVPIGATATGPFVIDLVEHGPHALIGGTSGAGKSELLISFVAGLIACHPPTSVNVLFVDYKGGASSHPFVDAPHTVGCVTNLDAFLARRALLSLRAELNRRMNLLAGRAKNLAEMIERHPTEAPPALVILVDELAALVQDVPEFVAGLVDIAQRGRSLGIHLVLATQRPAGVVNDNLLANTNLRIALRMLDGAESTSLIGSRDAASIPTEARGRAFVRSGPGRPTVVQAAWSAAPSRRRPGPGTVAVHPFVAADRARLRRSRAADQNATPSAGSGEQTQLDELLAAVAAAAATIPGSADVRPPWRPELPQMIRLDDVRSMAGEAVRLPGHEVVVGLLDEPEQQRQTAAVADLAAGGLAIFGVGGSGKTTALDTLARSAAADDEQLGGGRLTIVALDFGSQELAGLAALPQCSEVATGDDLEAVTRVIALLEAAVQGRRLARGQASGRVDATRGLGDERARPEQQSAVLVLIDDYGNLASTFEGAGASSALYPWFEALNRVIADGRQLGIHTALTATRRAAVKAGVLASVTNRIVFRQAEPGNYVELGLPARSGATELAPGRGFLSETTQVQIALAARESVAGGTVEPALQTQALPTEVSLDTILGTTQEQRAATTTGGSGSGEIATTVVLGIADLTHPDEPVTFDVAGENLVVVGDPGSGRSTALRTIGHQLVAAGAEVWAIGPSSSPVDSIAGLHHAVFGDADVTAEPLSRLAARCERAATSELSSARPILLVDDLDLLDHPALEQPFATICAAGIRWVATAATLRAYGGNPLAQTARNARSFLCLQPPGGREVHELTGVTPMFRPGLPMPPGRGVLVTKRRATVLQVAGT